MHALYIHYIKKLFFFKKKKIILSTTSGYLFNIQIAVVEVTVIVHFKLHALFRRISRIFNDV